ncbi:hypothetical protein A0O36_00064 [Piscirickettsiaceae bacterium NZ-RLO1]|nr:hypothetical protein A0O36_00064 [Piscirickettsiaceae bacterium NZ-RLO1]
MIPMKATIPKDSNSETNIKDQISAKANELTPTEENKVRAAAYAEQILSGHSSNKLAELNYLEDLFQRKEAIAKRAEENHRQAQQLFNEKMTDNQYVRQKIQHTEQAHQREMGHLSTVQHKLALAAHAAISLAAQKKRDEQRAQENIDKSISSYQNLISNLQTLKKVNDLELSKAEKLVRKTEKEALIQREASKKAKNSSLVLRQQLGIITGKSINKR